MRISVEAFPATRYLGNNDVNLGLTKGAEYRRLAEGTYWLGNTYGVWVTSDFYKGDDIDYATFVDLEFYNKNFSDKLPLKTSPKHSNRRKVNRKYKRRKIAQLRDLHSSNYVDSMLSEGAVGVLLRTKIRCNCIWCQMGKKAKDERRLDRLKADLADLERFEYGCAYYDRRYEEFREEREALEDANVSVLFDIENGADEQKYSFNQPTQLTYSINGIDEDLEDPYGYDIEEANWFN